MSTATITQDAQAALSSAAHFLLSLNAGLGGDNADAKLFSKFLLQSQIAPQPQPQLRSRAQPQAQSQPQPAAQDRASSAASSSSSNSTLPPLPALKRLVVAWRHLVEKLQGQGQENSSRAAAPATAKDTANSASNTSSSDASGNVQADGGNGSNAGTDTSGNSPDSATNASNAATASSGAGTAAADGADSANDGDSDSGTADAKTIADILKELQMLALLIQKQLQNLQNAAGNASSGNGAPDASTASGSAPGPAETPAQALADLTALLNSGAGSSTGATGADAQASSDANASGAADKGTAANSAASGTPTLAQALTDLLTLVQAVTQQLQAAQGAVNGAGSGTAGSAVPDPSITQGGATPWPSNAQLQADLKVLIDNLRKGAANDGQGLTQAAANPAAAQSPSFAAGPQKEEKTPSSAGADSNPAPAANASQNAWMQQEDFFGLFKNENGPASSAQSQTSVNAAALSLPATGAPDSGGKNGGASLDLGLNGRDDSSTPGGFLNTLDNSNLLATAGGNSQGTAPYSFASQLSAANNFGSGMTGLPDAVEQVVLQMSRNVKNGDNQMTLQLNPAELGRVDIKLNFSSDGKVQGTVVASNPATLHLLLKDVGGLERALQEAGLRADSGSLQFSLGNQSGNSSGQMPGQFSGGASGGDASLGSAGANTGGDPSLLPADTETYYLTPNRVNLRV